MHTADESQNRAKWPSSASTLAKVMNLSIKIAGQIEWQPVEFKRPCYTLCNNYLYSALLKSVVDSAQDFATIKQS